MRHWVLAGLVSGAIALTTTPGHATGPDGDSTRERAERTLRDGAEKTERAIRGAADEAEQALREGAEKIMKALELMFRSIPQYAAPEINKNGDIIIRRKRPRPAPRKSPSDEDGAST